MSTEKDFVPYQESLELKELGFDEPCFGYRESTFGKEKVIVEPSGLITNTNFSKIFGETRFRLVTPTFSQAFRWFREKYRLYSTIIFRVSMEDNNEYWDWLIKEEEVVYRHFKTYEEAELACLLKLIEITKEKEHEVQTN